VADDIAALTAAEIVAILGLAPHPEGGFYREMFRDAVQTREGRAASTAIYFLLPADVVSAWHRVDAAEVWHFYAGAPLRLTLYDAESGRRSRLLGTNLRADEQPQIIVPAGIWQMAQVADIGRGDLAAAPDWSLVGCTVAPGFTFAGFELAPSGWHPDGDYTAS
jgi:uncharacterized protein